MQGLRRFDVSRGFNVGDIATLGRYIKIPKAADVATRVNPVLPGRFIVQAAAGNSAVGDGASAADSTGTPSRLFLGLVMTLTDLRGKRLDKQILATTEEGLALVVPARFGAIFKGLEDAVGGAIADSGGHAALVLGAVSGEMPTETPYYTPFPNDEIDSSTIASGTSANRALRMVGPLPDVTNINSARRVWEFAINDAFAAVL